MTQVPRAQSLAGRAVEKPVGKPGNSGDTLRSQTVSTKLQRIAQQARQYPDMVFTTLAHLMSRQLANMSISRNECLM